jgi:hypothetical protein
MCEEKQGCINCYRLRVENYILRQQLAKLKAKIENIHRWVLANISGIMDDRKKPAGRVRFAFTKGAEIYLNAFSEMLQRIR